MYRCGPSRPMPGQRAPRSRSHGPTRADVPARSKGPMGARRPTGSRTTFAAVITVALLGAAGLMVPVASANHVQMDSGRIIVFDHVGGNEYWVEAQLAGQDGGQVASLWVAQYPASSTMWVQ